MKKNNLKKKCNLAKRVLIQIKFFGENRYSNQVAKIAYTGGGNIVKLRRRYRIEVGA